ncbi:hypothetical protein OM076_42145 [Solirubrobacter ginsenosidimutans]|uniref:Polymerase/histidinol phosphatase N-terminal domain-containing protein n=1 Tax=Solirubrobacter ginsenosidimutans TaxID=490573 RepID=A0A9X3S6L1_9ACTN|nr:hypothetical protein [Solirubrobacter ginsenosidimutans]MDA0166937.1 hypothetical protein [Solirubrobacter ginsenosidimutans]
MKLRVAAHVHSAWSYDGKWTLEQLARAFSKRGYDAVLMAEHDRTFDAARWLDYRDACAAASQSGALLVPGIEYSDAENRVHVPVWGADRFLGANRPTIELLRDAAGERGFSVIAHPGRRDAWTTLAPECFALASAIETWNRKYDGWAPSAIALRLAEEHGLRRFAGLDFHTAKQFFPMAMEVQSPTASGDGIFEALRAGTFAPVVLRLPGDRFASGPGLAGARTAEFVRRRLARAVRQVRGRVKRSLHASP